MIDNYLRSLRNPAVWLGALAVAVLLGLGSLGVMWFSPPPLAPARRPTAALTIIAWDTSTPLPTTTPTQALVEAMEAPATLQAGEIGIGSLVQIVGTGGEGLNIRSQPGLTSEVIFLGYDAEVFVIKDGPVVKDGFTWWYLVTPVDEVRSGWAAADYLSVFENP